MSSFMTRLDYTEEEIETMNVKTCEMFWTAWVFITAWIALPAWMGMNYFSLRGFPDPYT